MVRKHFAETTVTDIFILTREDIGEIIINSIKNKIESGWDSIDIGYNCSENCLDSVNIKFVYRSYRNCD